MISAAELDAKIDLLHNQSASLSWVIDQKINPEVCSENSLIKLLIEAISLKSVENIEVITHSLLANQTSDIALINVGKLLSHHPLLHVTRYAVQALTILLQRETTAGNAIIALQVLAEIYGRSDPVAEMRTRGDLINFDFEVDKNCQRILQISDESDVLQHAIDIAKSLQSLEIKKFLLSNLKKRSKKLRVDRLPTPSEMQVTIKDAIKRFMLNEANTKIKKTHKIVTGGSCFARSLGYYLQKAGYDTYRFILAEELNTTFANQQLFRWLSDKNLSNHNAKTLEQLFLKANLSKNDLCNYFKEADHFVFTLGTTQCFFNGNDQFRITPPGIANFRKFLKTHTPRMTSVLENEANINDQIDLIRALNPQASIFFTLSPVPLNTSFCGKKAISADCISKSTLRVAIENVLHNRNDENISYFPSFEIVRWLAPMYMKPFGQDDGSMSHVTDKLVEHIINSFLEHHK